MKKSYNLLIKSVTLCLITISTVLVSCQDDISGTGVNLMPEDQYYTPYYNASSFINSINIDTIRRSDDMASVIIGTYKDPLFGEFTTDFLVQFLPKDTGDLTLNEKDIEVIESLKLIIPFQKGSWYGDSTAKHDIKIYELKQMLTEDKYYPDMSVDGLYYDNPIATGIKSAKDGYVNAVWNKDTTWQFTIDLTKTDLAKRLLFIDYKKEPGTVTINKFYENFKGLYITSNLVNKDTANLVALPLIWNENVKEPKDIPVLKFILKYRLKSDINKTLTRTYASSIDCKRIFRSQTVIDTEVQKDNSKLYIQGFTGRTAEITLDKSYLESWNDSIQQKNNKYGFSNLLLTLKIDEKAHNVKVNYTITELQVWLKRLNGDGSYTDKTAFAFNFNSKNAAATSGYVIEDNIPRNASNDNKSIAIGLLKPEDLSFNFRINPQYFEAYLAFLANPDSVVFNTGGKYSGFTRKDATGAYLYIYDLEKLLIMPAAGSQNNLNRLILKGPGNTEEPLKLEVKYYKY